MYRTKSLTSFSSFLYNTNNMYLLTSRRGESCYNELSQFSIKNVSINISNPKCQQQWIVFTHWTKSERCFLALGARYLTAMMWEHNLRNTQVHCEKDTVSTLSLCDTPDHRYIVRKTLPKDWADVTFVRFLKGISPCTSISDFTSSYLSPAVFLQQNLNWVSHKNKHQILHTSPHHQ